MILSLPWVGINFFLIKLENYLSFFLEVTTNENVRQVTVYGTQSILNYGGFSVK